jgi:hypothetical protein
MAAGLTKKFMRLEDIANLVVEEAPKKEALTKNAKPSNFKVQHYPKIGNLVVFLGANRGDNLSC